MRFSQTRDPVQRPKGNPENIPDKSSEETSDEIKTNEIEPPTVLPELSSVESSEPTEKVTQTGIPPWVEYLKETPQNITYEFQEEIPTELPTETPTYYETEPPAIVPEFFSTIPPVPNVRVTQNGVPLEQDKNTQNNIHNTVSEDIIAEITTEFPIDDEGVTLSSLDYETEHMVQLKDVPIWNGFIQKQEFFSCGKLFIIYWNIDVPCTADWGSEFYLKRDGLIWKKYNRFSNGITSVIEYNLKRVFW